MSKQRRDAAVLSDAAKFNAVTRELKRYRHRNGIRSRFSERGRAAREAGVTWDWRGASVTLPVSELGRG